MSIDASQSGESEPNARLPSESAGEPTSPAPWKRLLWAVCILGFLASGIVSMRFAAHDVAGHRALRNGGVPAIVDIAVLVLREGLECVLVLAAITASFKHTEQTHSRSVAAGVGLGFVATLLTWLIAVRILDDIGQSISALEIQAATGLLAVIVLLVVMNWFFHKTYWTGWISFHNQRKKELLDTRGGRSGKFRLVFGMALLGFTSFYREGFEVVLFLQSFRLRFGGATVLCGVLLGVLGSGAVAIFTFVAHRLLPYRKMLVLTGITLGFVLLVMVGEEAQEMQLARWLPATPIHALSSVIPAWMGTWFSVFPTVETLAAQAVAAVLVLGSYVVASSVSGARNRMA